MYLWAQQIKHLVLKNMLISSRNKVSTLFQFVSPFIVCAIILGLQHLAEDFNDISTINPKIQSVPYTLDRCDRPSDCITIGYGVYGETNEWINYTIQHLKQINNFDDRDVVFQYQGNDFKGYNQYFLDNRNKTFMAVYFCTDKIICSNGVFIGLNSSQLYVYNIVYNKTMIPTAAFQSVDASVPKNQQTLILKNQMDDILINYLKQQKNKDHQFTRHIDIQQQEYPKVPNRLFKGYDVMSAQGSFYFIVPPIFTFLYFCNEMLKEKEHKLRQYMQIVGVSNWVFWTAQIITILIFSLLLSLVMTVSGYIFQFKFFTQTPFMILYSVFFTFTFSMQFVSIFIVVLSPTQKIGNSISYGFLLLCWVIQILLSNTVLVYALYQDNIAEWVVVIRKLLTLYPPFNFSKIWGDITQHSGYHWDLVENRWVSGDGYHWDYINNKQSGPFGQNYFETPSTSANIGFIWMDLLLFFVLSIYFDQVLSHNRGAAKKWWFFLDIPSFFNRFTNNGTYVSRFLIFILSISHLIYYILYSLLCVVYYVLCIMYCVLCVVCNYILYMGVQDGILQKIGALQN